MESFKTYLEESTINVEEVKVGMIQYINDALVGANATSATIRIGRHKIQNVVAAKPSNKRSTGGILPYVDISLVLQNGAEVDIGLRVARDKKFLVYRGKSLRRYAIPALYHGIHSLEKMYPEVREHFVSSLLNYYRNKGYDHGSHVDVVYGKIKDDIKETLLLGNSRFGGKIDYLFAIDRVPFTWKRIKIPSMSASYERGLFTIVVGNARAFTASEIMVNNDIYVWPKKFFPRLYLGDDKVDKNNLPVIYGPPRNRTLKEYGIVKYGLGLNINTKESFVIEDNTRAFRLELRDTKELLSRIDDVEMGHTDRDDINSTPSADRGYRPGGRGSDSMNRNRQEREKQDKEEFGSKLSPDERKEYIDKVIDSANRGIRHRFNIDLDRAQEKSLEYELEKIDDNELKRMLSIPSHRLAVEIKDTYL